MKTKHRYGSHELSTPQQLGAGLGEAEEGARGSSRSPASAGAEMLGWERGNRSSTQPSLMGEGGFFFPFLASKGWEVGAWCVTVGLAEGFFQASRAEVEHEKLGTWAEPCCSTEVPWLRASPP